MNNQPDLFVSFSKRLNFSQKTNIPLKFYLQVTPPSSQINEPIKQVPLQNPIKLNAVTLLKKPGRSCNPFKKLAKVLEGHGKLNFHSEMIYIRKNLFNPEVKTLQSLTQPPPIPSMNSSAIKNPSESVEAPLKPNEEHCLNARKLNIFEIKRKQEKEAKPQNPQIPKERNLFLSKKYLARRKASEIEPVSLITKRPLQCSLPRLAQKLRLSPSVSFSNDIMGWS